LLTCFPEVKAGFLGFAQGVWEIKAARLFETSDINYLTTWCNSPEHLLSQQSRGGQIKSLFPHC
jgi:hypothetical protein